MNHRQLSILIFVPIAMMAICASLIGILCKIILLGKLKTGTEWNKYSARSAKDELQEGGASLFGKITRKIYIITDGTARILTLPMIAALAYLSFSYKE